MNTTKYTRTEFTVSNRDVACDSDSRYVHSIVFSTGRCYDDYIGIKAQREHRKDESIEQWSEIILDIDDVKKLHAFLSEHLEEWSESEA